MASTEFPGDRPATYDPDKVFDEDTGTWVDDEDINRLGGGRYRTTIVTACNYNIYYEELT
jgi:hypothetical protein